MNTNAATSLDRLHDIVVPPPVAWWPPAPGWHWVLGFSLILLLLLALKTFIRWQHNRYRREALAELARQEIALKNPGRRAAALAALAELLKRTALSAFPRAEIARLTGGVWFEFLDRTGRMTGFTQGNGAILENAAYDPRTTHALDEQKIREVISTVRHWIQHHQLEIQPKQTKTTKPSKTENPSLPSFSSVQKIC